MISIFFDDREEGKRDDLQIIPFALSRQFYVLIEKETHVEQLQPSPSFPYLLLFPNIYVLPYLTVVGTHIKAEEEKYTLTSSPEEEEEEKKGTFF